MENDDAASASVSCEQKTTPTYLPMTQNQFSSINLVRAFMGCKIDGQVAKGELKIVIRLGDFWNFLAINFVTKVAQMFGDFLGNCENHHILSQTGEVTFWATFRKTWATFNFKIWSY